MISTLTQQPLWAIDQLLERLQGESLRAAATAFAPVRSDGLWLWTPVRNLVLPDNSAAAGLPVFFEGQLLHHRRQVGLVFVELGALGVNYDSAEGITLFRGTTTVIVRGPAWVKLAYPFRIEKLPPDSFNYWQDLHVPQVQLEMLL